MNTVEVVFTEFAKKANLDHALWQWDRGQKLVPAGIHLPDFYDVHFCNVGDAEITSEPGDSEGVMIPDKYMRTGKDICAYIYVENTEDGTGRAWYEITIQVNRRPKPDDYERM